MADLCAIPSLLSTPSLIERLIDGHTTPNYNDTAPQPATAAKWKYQAIYRIGDRRVGQWSQEVTVAVGA